MFRENARPLAMVALVLGLIAMAAMEAEGYQPVLWFRYFAVGIISEWFIERGVRKRTTQ